jgi:hypothetical protein
VAKLAFLVPVDVATGVSLRRGRSWIGRDQENYPHEQRQRQREMFMPVQHDTGHPQVDFGEAPAVIGDYTVEKKIHFFAMGLKPSVKSSRQEES